MRAWRSTRSMSRSTKMGAASWPRSARAPRMASPDRIDTSRSAESPPRRTPILRCPIISHGYPRREGPSKNCTSGHARRPPSGFVVKEGAMTFLEAALKILSREGRPLHFKELTERAMTKKLLTFVGRTPEVTMQTQLTAAIKKAPGNPFVRVKPGVFGLLRYPELPPEEPEAPPAKAEKAEKAEKGERPEARG